MKRQFLATEGLTESQKKAVWHKQGPLLIIAGPGSGKTRVITNRIAALISQDVEPHKICAITFTNKAADEMRNRVIAMNMPGGVHVSTFHSLCVRILRWFAQAAGISENFSIYNESDQKNCVKDAIKAAELDAKNFPPGRILETISRLKNNLQDITSFTAESGDYFSQCLAKIYSNYQKILSQNNALDFDDLLLKTAFLLRDFGDIRKQLSQRYEYLMVDEYQDTNHAQYQIARGLSLEHGNICVTGDPDQSIYGWRGADIGNILAFEHDWPEATVIKLEENFRSLPEILAVADKLISANKGRKQKKLVPVKKGGAEIVVRCLDDEQDEADFIADFIKQLLDNGEDANRIAVFYRVNSMSRAIEEAFVESQVPYQIVRGVEFYNRREIRDILAFLRLIVNDADDRAFLRIINTPPRGIGKTTISRLSAYAADKNTGLYNTVKNCEKMDTISAGAKAKLKKFAQMIEDFKKHIDDPVAILMDRVFKQSGLHQSLQAQTAEEDYSKASPLDNVAELISSAKRFDSQQGGLVDFLQHIALFSDTDTLDLQSGRVSLMTLHCAKGLEFDNVCIIGLEQGILPHERSMDAVSEIEEERRLFFVGITRAKKRLCITLSRHRTIHGQTIRTIGSQFLYEAALEPDQAAEQDENVHDEGVYYETGVSCSDSGSSGGAFSVGQLVSHKKFGLGRVKEFHNLGDNSIIVVQFKTGQVKPLMLKYAGLDIVE
ncbi:MAG: UvrD-helicase domain-containing protein [Sedimentisphaerales bacterium]|nr:UvrD-helicase domain-containing protein [Sedimentisphaerales bacterium]